MRRNLTEDARGVKGVAPFGFLLNAFGEDNLRRRAPFVEQRILAHRRIDGGRDRKDGIKDCLSPFLD
jgi:hypothetical protein